MQNLLEIIPIPAFKDNYIWLLRFGENAVVVDPGDAAPVIRLLHRLSLNLTAILITHHHSDHIGGVHDLLSYHRINHQNAITKNINVYAPRLEHYDFPHIALDDLSQVKLPEIHQTFNVMSIPGHTLGHIAYYNAPNLFCGDTLFGAGCGRLFEGTPAQMLQSLQRLAALPSATQVYCTHEYTLHNIDFALNLEPNNAALIQRKVEAQALRAQGLPTLPSNIELELKTNPFLRCNQLEIIHNISIKNTSRNTNNIAEDFNDVLSVFTQAREMRNSF